MAEEDIENARHAYAALNEAYRTGDPARFLPVLERSWAPDAVFTPAGILPESAPVQGWDGVLGFIAEQMKAFKHGTMWIEPLEYIGGDNVLVVPYRFGGRAAYTGLDVEFAFAHVFFWRAGKVVQAKVFASTAEALAAAGIARPVDVVRASWRALATGGLDAMAAHWHPDIEWRAVEGAVDDVGVFRGRERMRRYYADWLGLFDEHESNVESVLCEEGDMAAVIIVTRARPRGTDAWARGRYAVVYTVRDGLVVRGREYPSADAARAAAAALAGY